MYFKLAMLFSIKNAPIIETEDNYSYTIAQTKYIHQEEKSVAWISRENLVPREEKGHRREDHTLLKKYCKWYVHGSLLSLDHIFLQKDLHGNDYHIKPCITW